MATEQNGGVQLSTLYSLVASLYLSLLTVLVASSLPIDHWFRFFVMAILLGSQVTFMVLSRRARKAEQRARTVASASAAHSLTAPEPRSR